MHREFASKYKQTILGPGVVHPPAADDFAGVHAFSRAHREDADGWNPADVLFFLCNQLGWNYLQQNLMTGGAIFTNNANLFGKVYFPRLVVPLSVVLSNLFACVLQLVTFLLIYLGFC